MKNKRTTNQSYGFAALIIMVMIIGLLSAC